MSKEKNPSGDVPAKNEPEKTKTVYTHGKKFVIPESKKLEDFLKEKFPSEYK